MTDAETTAAWQKANARGKRYIEGVVKGYLARARPFWCGNYPPERLLRPTEERVCAVCDLNFTVSEEWPLGLHPCLSCGRWHWACFNCVREWEMIGWRHRMFSTFAPYAMADWNEPDHYFHYYFAPLSTCPADVRDGLAVAEAVMGEERG